MHDLVVRPRWGYQAVAAVAADHGGTCPRASPWAANHIMRRGMTARC